MSKKSKRWRREHPKPPGPENLKLRAEGKVIVAWRGGAIAELLDCAIWLWFLQSAPLSTHLLAMSAYQCLEDLGKNKGKGPFLKERMGNKKFTAYYDFLRHASSNPQVGIDFPPSVNGPIIFDAAVAFQKIFGGYVTASMLAFKSYFIAVKPEMDMPEEVVTNADKLLPKGITLQEARSLSRLEAYNRLSELFAAEIAADIPVEFGGSHIESP
jgi:hypothetical protein